MRKVLEITAALVVLLTICSCSVSKEARQLKQEINGSWMLETITTEGISGRVTATLFNEASFNCFVGSSWNFTASNSKGSYNINASGTECSAVQRLVRWSIFEPKGEPKMFQFKRLDDKGNPLDDNAGFRFEITSITGTTMQLKSQISFEGKPATYVYNFVKK